MSNLDNSKSRPHPAHFLRDTNLVLLGQSRKLFGDSDLEVNLLMEGERMNG